MKTISGADCVKAAKHAGLKVEYGKGDHVKVYGPAGRGYETIPMHRELATGTACSIRKWFKALGILLVLGMMACMILCYLAH